MNLTAPRVLGKVAGMNLSQQDIILHDLGVGLPMADGRRLTRERLAEIIGCSPSVLSSPASRSPKTWTAIRWAWDIRRAGRLPEAEDRVLFPDRWVLTCQIVRGLVRDELDQLGPRLREWGIEVDVEALMAAHGDRIGEAFAVEGWAGVLVVVREANRG